MKRTYLVLFAILLTVIFAACSSDKDKHGEEDEFDPKKTFEYEMYGQDVYGLVGDVKTLTRTDFISNREENEEGEMVLTRIPFAKKTVTFDKLGFSTKIVDYVADDAGELQLLTVSEHKFDSQVRELESTSVVYDVEEAGKVAISRKYIYEYDDVAKELLRYNYASEGGAALKFEDITVMFLDDEGRIVQDYAEHQKFEEELFPRAFKSSSTTKPLLSHELIHHTKKDQKGNVILSYDAYKQGEPIQEIANYYEQSIEYHDGSKSEAGELQAEIKGGEYVVPKLADNELVGNVKTTKMIAYEDAVWNEKEQKATGKNPYFGDEYHYDDKGAATLHLRSYPDETGEKLKVANETTYKYDDKFRITTRIQKLHSSEDITISRDEITYDDANKTATLLKYNTEEGEDGLIIKLVYKLAADGTISFGNYDVYSAKAPEARMAKGALPIAPSEVRIWRNVKIFDSPGNWKEAYEKNKYTGKDGVYLKTEISDYVTREITYY